MGRYSTGATTTNESLRLSIKFLKEHGYLENNSYKGGAVNYSVGETPSGSISIGVNTMNEPYVRFRYTITDPWSGEKTNRDYMVDLERVPSNLGKGFRYYFNCPTTGRRCSILYQAYGSHFFKSREAYQNRIYYPSQLENKRFRGIRMFDEERTLEELYRKRRKHTYKGRKTKITQRIEWLEKRFERSSILGWIALDNMIKGMK